MRRTSVWIFGLVAAMVLAMLAPMSPANAVDTVDLQADTFSRSVGSGWGTADVGGDWQLSTDSGASVNGSEGLIYLPRASTRTAALPGVVTGPMAVTLRIVLPKLPEGGDVTSGLTLRREGGNYYFVRVRVDPQGDGFLSIQGQLEAGTSWTLTPEVRLGRVAGGGTINLVAASEVDDVLVTASAWIDGTQRPGAWQVSAYDTDLPDAGEVGIRLQSTVATAGLELGFDDFEVLQEGTNLAPVADFEVTADGLTVQVDGSASNDPDGTIVEYAWDYGDGSTATGVRPAPKTYAANGTYTISLTVRDNLGMRNTATQEVVVNANNAPPIASFTTVIDALNVTVDASESTDNDGEIAEYQWDFGDGTTATGPTPAVHSYAAAGTYTIELTVTDNQGAKDRVSQEVTVTANQPPEAQFVFTSRGLQLYVNGKVSSDPDGDVVGYDWEYGDGATATGPVPPIHTYAAGGTYSVTLKVTDNRGATNTISRPVNIIGQGGAQPTRGAQLPVVYNVSDLKGTPRFVAPNGSDETGNGTEARPYRTLKKAVAVSQAGDSVVVRGGTYDITENSTSIGKANLTVTAYPGETPVFDGSQAAPAGLTTEGSLKWFSYTPMRAKTGEGLNLNQLPEAKFDSAGNATGLGLERGWRCVYGSTSNYDPPGASGSGSRCPSGTKAYMIAGYYPDQVWVNGRSLVQVLDKSKVKQGTFYVERNASNDDDPSPSRLYLSTQDSADMSKVRVSSSSGNFLHVAATGVTLRGMLVQNHSPAWPFFALTVTSAVNDFTAQDMEFDYVTSVAVKVAGGDAANQSGLTLNPTLDRVTIKNASWIGTSQLYTTNGTVSNSVITNSNFDQEFNTAPKSGGIKATKTQGMKVVNSEISYTKGHGIWWDQSNYNATLANSSLVNNTDSAVFYEISFGLTMVNNVVTRAGPSSSPTIRMAGATKVALVNNTIVGGQVPVALAGDPRSKTYGPNNRYCAEHTERYRQGGSVASDCPPALSSDLDKARPGQYGTPNLTPGMNWRPSAALLVNNIMANPIPGSGGICPGGYPLCVKNYAGSSAKPDVAIPANQVLPGTLVMNGNLYQSASTVSEHLVQSGGQGGFTSTSVEYLKGPNGLGSSFYGLSVEANGLKGDGYVTADGAETAKLAPLHSQAAPVPNDPMVTQFIPAGTRHYGALDVGTGEIPTDLPTASFTTEVDGFSVTATSTSTFDKGQIVATAWDFGDDTGVQFGTPFEHIYELPGTYTITMGVIGDNGAFDIATKDVTITDPGAEEPVGALDTFTRLLPSGWGDADVGGAWTLTGDASKFAVNGERGVMRLEPSKTLKAVLKGAPSESSQLDVRTGTSEPITGGGVFVSAMPRVMPDGSAYRAKVNIRANGTAALSLTRINASGQETVIASAPTTVPGAVSGMPLNIRVQAVGSSPTALKAKIWIDTQDEPADWQLEAEDNTAGLQAAGGAGLFTYESGTATSPVEWLYDDFKVTEPDTAEPPVVPVADDAFGRSVASGWGAADTGGDWSVTGGAAKYSVNGQQGVMSLDPGKSLKTALNGAVTDSADLSVATWTTQALTGGGVFVSAMPRTMADGSAYRAKINIKPNGSTTLSLTRINASGAETILKSATTNLTGVVAGTPMHIRAQAVGKSPTTLRAKIWLGNAPEPEDWQVEVTDSTAGLQSAGGSGLFAYESSSATAPVPLLFDDFRVVPAL